MIAFDAVPPGVNAAGVGRVALGSSYVELRREGRIGTLRPGCEPRGDRRPARRAAVAKRGSV